MNVINFIYIKCISVIYFGSLSTMQYSVNQNLAIFYQIRKQTHKLYRYVFLSKQI